MNVAFILVGLISLSAGSQLTCKFESKLWSAVNFQPSGYYQTCVVNNQAVNSPDSKIETFSKDKATAISVNNIKVKFIPNNLAALPDLYMVSFGYCAISSIGNQFKGLRELVFLCLASNQIEDIQNDAFADLVKVEWLLLDESKVKHVNGELFKTLVSLKTLILSKNQIESIDSSAFVNLINLEYLDLHSNKLTFIEAKTFQNLIKLQKLYLYGNKIDSIDPDTFDTLKSLDTVSLSGNICINEGYSSSVLNDLKNDVMTKCKPKSEKTNKPSKEISTPTENLKPEVNTETLNLNTNLTTFMENVMDAMKSLKTEIENSKNQDCSIETELKKIQENISTFKAEIGAIREEFAGALKTEQGRSESCSQKNLELSLKFEMVNTNLKEERSKVAELTKNMKELKERHDFCLKIIE